MDADQPHLYDSLRPLDNKQAEEIIKEKLVNLFQKLMRLYGLDHRHRNQVLKISETINLLIENNFSYLECEEGINQACDNSPKYFPQALEILAETKRYSQRNKKAPLAIKSESEGDKAKVESEKGGLSDAFKRAAVHWGINRSAYGLGNTWVNLTEKGYLPNDIQRQMTSKVPASYMEEYERYKREIVEIKKQTKETK